VGILRSQATAYRRVLGRPVLRRILPAMLLSAIGDGMSLVAVAWLAVRIAPAGQAGVWTALAVAAYALPATLGAALLARLVRGLSGTALVTVDATLRAIALGAIAALAIADALGPALYVILLAGSSLLHAWGNAGAYTLIAELVPDEDRLTGNAVLSTFTQASYVVGPALAGGLTAWAGPGWVIAVDAASWAVLAVMCRRASTPTASAQSSPVSMEPIETNTATSGTRAILSDPRLTGLLAVTCVFFFLYGPVEVALPIHIAQEIGGSAALLGAFWATFGVGAILGGLGAGLLRHQPLWTVVAVIIIGWGAALLPLGLTDSVLPGLVGFAAGGLIYGPFTAICTALFQRSSPPHVLSRVLATRTALTTPSTALGTLLGGPIVTAIGGRRTLLASAVLTIALGVAVAAVSRRSAPRAGCRSTSGHASAASVSGRRAGGRTA
jgi:predicted MFS family arabinose efflux permease